MNSVSHLETYKITKHPVAKLNEEGDGAGKGYRLHNQSPGNRRSTGFYWDQTGGHQTVVIPRSDRRVAL